MVCDRPRKRSVFINRRGAFFEDPFFRDSWPDYNSAVRRIVDRFNHGWVSASDRIRDTQYQSMYRTLRSAKQNYSTHSARFKEENDGFKLVMDVHEFLGGDITVRTAGSTVSVRGKLEGDVKGKNSDTEDTESIISGRSSSTRTLHRRFTLPAEADCDQIESSISKDAVLTVIIPKKKPEVRYIPVTLESTRCKPSYMEEDKRKVGIKRPNDSPLLSSRKKQQDETTDRPVETSGWRSRFRDLMENKENECQGNLSRRKSRFEAEEPERKSTFKRRSPDIEKAEIKSEEPQPKERRRMSAKYEDAHEIHIPVTIGTDRPSNKVFISRRVSEPKVHHIEIVHESQSPKYNGMDIPSSPVVEEPQSPVKSPYQPNYLDATVPQSTATDITELEPVVSEDCEAEPEVTQNGHDGTKDSPKKRLWTKFRKPLEMSQPQEEVKTEQPPWRLPSRRSLSKSRANSLDLKSPKDPTSNSFIFDKIAAAPIKIREIKPSEYFQKSESSIDNTIHETSEITDKEEAAEYSRIPSVEIHESELPINETDNLNIDTSKLDIIETPGLSTAISKSPSVSPGGREVTVEKRQSLMEDDMFKDCWCDFSNTLQDVLNRLQELSTELGQSKILTDSTPGENAEKNEESVHKEESQEMSGSEKSVVTIDTDDESDEPQKPRRSSVSSEKSQGSVTFTLDLTKKRPVRKIVDDSSQEGSRPTSLVFDDSSLPDVQEDSDAESDVHLDSETTSRAEDTLSPQSAISTPRECVSPPVCSDNDCDNVEVISVSSSVENGVDQTPMLNEDGYNAWKSSILTEKPTSPLFEYHSLYGVTKRPSIKEDSDVECLEIPNDDVMVRKQGNVSQRPHVRSPPSAKSECQRLSGPHKQRFRTEERSRKGHEPSNQMGSVFSRGSQSTQTAQPLKQGKTESPEPVLPPYIKHKSEPHKTAGFSQVNSNNVKRMRDVWAKQDSKSQEDPKIPSKRTDASPWRHVSPSRKAPVSPVEKTTPRRYSPSPTRRVTTSPPKTRPTSYTADHKTSYHRPRFERPSSPVSVKKHPTGRAQYTKGFDPSLLTSTHKENNRKTGTLPSEPSFEARREGKSTAAPESHHRIFKRFRNANLQPDSEALCFKEEEDRYKMVLDVQEFVAGEVEVLQDDRLLTVKGKVETKDESTVCSRTFNRTFDIPQNSREEEIDSNLSQDGILTIYVPKKKERIIKIELVD